MSRKSEPIRWGKNPVIVGKPNMRLWLETEAYLDTQKAPPGYKVEYPYIEYPDSLFGPDKAEAS